MDFLFANYAAGVEARCFRKLVVHRQHKSTFMMYKTDKFLRVRVEDANRLPIDCMVYQIEPDVFWTRSLYDENEPQVFNSAVDAKKMLDSYVDVWQRKKASSVFHETVSSEILGDRFYECSIREAILFEGRRG